MSPKIIFFQPIGLLGPDGSMRHLDEAPQDLEGWEPIYVRRVKELTAGEEGVEVAASEAYRVPPCPIAELIGMYHRQLPTLDRVLMSSKHRDSLIRARWREVCSADKLNKDDGLKFFSVFFCSVSSSKFLTGRTEAAAGRRPFRADLAWLMRPTNFVKVCEGKYL
jgi:hypothetical protein